ncbi:DUF1836 domain-containing protein [Paenibacillus spongiae]|uniref:DUF1836 domain-containing protein n=1 Tax=Paenibacillus spongiae TaxID=2909671 RepID=A0ABY5SGH9_9BACL|nr:DUF1836 domain-containing protein [Paenibacillus spongiae]UVI32759.1 DUF1836 domain-containing protein [Paenibacillus spongiae]
MELLTLTRRDMAALLFALNGQSDRPPLAIIQDIWRANHQQAFDQGNSMSAFVATSLPPIIERMIKAQVKPALSLSDIVSLGTQIEYTQFSVTSIQNWVKRDFKDFIGQPAEGKKYSLQQVALFFIIEDLRSTLDYDSIRKLLELMFGQTWSDQRLSISPMAFYAAYSELYEILDERYRNFTGERMDFINKWDQMINELSNECAKDRGNLSSSQQDALKNAIHVAVIAVHTASFHSLARRYVNGMVFLNNL